ncbi:MAG: IS3 family transposase [Gemmatimonadaceae bacterium]|nr:IS3 family transposase [Gemmatimonadaceae bacterium]
MAQRGARRRAARPVAPPRARRPDARAGPAVDPRADTHTVTGGARPPKSSHPVLFRSKAETFAYIDTQRATYGVSRLCRRYGVTRAGYYAWRRRLSAHAQQDRTLLAVSTRLFATQHGRDGSPRIHHVLLTRSYAVSRRRVARLMYTAGLRARAVRGYRAKVGTHRFYEQHPNRVRRLVVHRPHQVWVGDITYLTVAGEWRYLAVVMDRYSRRILAWTLQRRRDATVTTAMLQTAVRHRHPPAGLTFHSDRGSEHGLNRSSQQLWCA